MSREEAYPSVYYLAERARQRIPHFAWEYLDSGTGPEDGVARNEAALRAVELVPRMMAGRYEPELETSLFDRTYSAPFGVAPVGMSGVMWAKAEIFLAAAARAAGLPYTLSCVAAETPETIGPVAGENGWFQFYPTSDDDVRNDLLRRASEAGFKVLVVTVDVPISSTRERQHRAGLSVPPKTDLRTLWRAAIRPAWSLAMLQYRIPRLRTLEIYARDSENFGEMLGRVLEGRPDWDYLAALRDLWKGPMLIKGIMHPDDAERSVALGVDGIVVSNHGARQLDGAPASIDVLPAIAGAVGGRTKILFDSGLRGGLDIARALALGADFCLLGRPFLFAVGALGEPGAAHVMALLKDDLRNNMIQLGARSIADLRTYDIRTIAAGGSTLRIAGQSAL